VIEESSHESEEPRDRGAMVWFVISSGISSPSTSPWDLGPPVDRSFHGVASGVGGAK
jgi:hypothetical protein